jgi:hypothetical protein
MAQRPLVVDYALLCDDVRMENNGKQIFIGVYSDDIVLNTFPVDLLLNAVVKFKANEVKSHDVVVSAFADKERIMEGKARFTLEKVGSAFAALPIPIMIRKPCTLTIKLKIGPERANTLLKMQVREASPAPTA